MKILEKIWADVRHGDNIDQYATIGVAFVLVVLSVLGVTPANLLAPLILAVLGLLAVSNLANRYRLEALAEKMGQPARAVFLEEYPAELNQDFQAAKEVILIGVTLSRFIKNNYGKIEAKIQQGHSIKVLLVHPAGAPLEMAANRFYAEANRNPERKAGDILNSLELLCDLKKIAPQQLEIRTIQSPLSYGVVAVDMQAPAGKLYIEHFPYRTAFDAQPKFVINASDQHWYEVFSKEIQSLWSSGVEWSCKS